MRKETLLVWIFGLALVLRLILMTNPGFEADVSFWKSWGLATYDKGIVEGMKVTNNNYPTPFAYVLGTMVAIYSRFADPHDFNVFWSNTNLLFLAISKAFPILADFGIAFVILLIGRNAAAFGFPAPTDEYWGLSLYELGAGIYLLNPLSLMDGAWWGQVDSLGVCIFLLALVSLLRHKSFLAGLIFMVAMMTKLQNMIYGPIFFLLIWQLEGYEGLIQALGGAVIGFFGLNIEFFLTRNMDRVLASLTENFDYFPWMSLNAFNLWWIVTGAHGMQVSDKLLSIGVVNAKSVGLLLFSGVYLVAVVQQFFSVVASGNRRTSVFTFLTSLILVNAAFFLFQTQSHDRYAFPICVFLILWAPFFLARFSKPMTRRRQAIYISFWYLLFTVVYFYNLHTALAINYPANSLPILASLTQPVFTIGASLILLGLFGVFLFELLRLSRPVCYAIVGVIFIIAAALTFLNRPLLTLQPISLTTLVPFISEQAYGTRQTNRSVQSSFGGPNSWTRLSVQYVFYKLGIGTHADSKLVFDINSHFRRFTTDFGIDTEAGPKASAVFELYGDNKLLFRSGTMGRFDLPGHADVNVTGIKSLTLITTDAGDGNVDDHTDWLDPKLWP